MTTLLRFGWRELLRSKGRFALIALILMIQAAALGGGFVAFDSLFATRDHYYEKLHVANLEVQFVAAAPDELPSMESLGQIPGVASVSRRFVALGYIQEASGPLPVTIHYLDPDRHPAVDDIEMQSGSFIAPGNAEGAVVDRSFAEGHGLRIGDKLIINPNRFESKLEVIGTALSPEYLVPTANPDMLVPNKGSLGIIYASRESLDRIFADELYNQLLFTYQPGADEKATKAAVLASLKGLDIERVVPKTSNFGYRYVDEILGGSRIFMPMTAALLALMAAIVAFISVHRLVVSRRREIGGLLAQGYSPKQFVVGFLVLGIVPGVAGGLLGIPGAIGFGTNLARTNASIAGFPEPIMTFGASNLAFAAASAVVVGLLSALLPALAVLRLRPAHALRGGNEISFAGLPAPIERLLAGTASARYAFRNIFRRLRLSLATAVLVALAVAMPSGLLTSIASWDAWAKNQTATVRWDAVTSFKVALKEDVTLKLMSTDGIGDYEGYVQGYATVRRGETADEMRVRGLPVPSDLVSLDLKAGRGFGGEDAKEAILNSAFSRGERVPRVGETITVDFKGKLTELTVVGVVTDASLSSMFVPRGTAQEIFDLHGKYSGAYLTFGKPTKPRKVFDESLPPPAARPEYAEKLDFDEAPAAPIAAPKRKWGTDARGMKSALLENELVTSVQIKSEIGDATLRYLSAFNAIVIPFVGMGGLLAFFFLLSVLGFLLLERETEYATLRTMGYGRSEIARIVLTEVGTLTAVGLVTSVATWIGTSYLLRDLMAKAWFSVPVDFRALDYGVVAVPTLAFLFLAALPGIRGLMRLDLASVLRARAMG